MVKETVHIVLPYWEDKRKGLVPAEALPVRSRARARQASIRHGKLRGRERLHHHRRRGAGGVRGEGTRVVLRAAWETIRGMLMGG